MGYIYLYYGTGGGKTANALGLALRSVGQGRRVVIIQFMKWWTETGEYRIADRLQPYYEIYQFGRQGWLTANEAQKNVEMGGVNLQVRGVEKADKDAAKKGLDFAKRKLDTSPNLLVLDEICLAVHLGLLDVGDVLHVLKTIPECTDVVLTGRYASKGLIDRADFVNEVIEKKSPTNFVMTKGIQF